MSRHRLLVECYRSGQMSERQWQEHLKDEVFARWVAIQGIVNRR